MGLCLAAAPSSARCLPAGGRQAWAVAAVTTWLWLFAKPAELGFPWASEVRESCGEGPVRTEEVEDVRGDRKTGREQPGSAARPGSPFLLAGPSTHKGEESRDG